MCNLSTSLGRSQVEKGEFVEVPRCASSLGACSGETLSLSLTHDGRGGALKVGHTSVCVMSYVHPYSHVQINRHIPHAHNRTPE